jgi:hypothetical protein
VKNGLKNHKNHRIMRWQKSQKLGEKNFERRSKKVFGRNGENG